MIIKKQKKKGEMEMQKNTKLIIGITIAIIILIMLTIIIVNKNNDNKEMDQTNDTVEEKYVERLEDGTKVNKSTKLQETKKIDGMEIKDFKITEKDNVTVLLGTITNKSNEKKGGYPIDIKILDDKGNEIITVGGYIGEVEPEESIQLNCSATFDYANAYDFEIIKK